MTSTCTGWPKTKPASADLATFVGVIALAIVLVVCARATAQLIRIPAVFSPLFGIVLSATGAGLLLMHERFFRILPHPIPAGLCILCAGVSIAFGSASGLWLVSPIFALVCTAVVLRNEPGTQILPAGELQPSASDIWRSYLFILVPWLTLYEAVLAIGIPPDAISGTMAFEKHLPVIEWTQILYASTYFLAILAPVAAKTKNDLRWYFLRGWGVMLIAYPAFLLIPLIAPKRPFTPHTIPGHLLLWERSLDSSAAAFPSFHVIWAILAAVIFARRWPRLKSLFYGWAILIAISCVTTSQHSILDVIGGAATAALVIRGPRLWASDLFHKLLMPAAICVCLLVGSFMVKQLSTGIGAGLVITAILTSAAWWQAIALLRRLPRGAPLLPAQIYNVCIALATPLILTRLWSLSAPVPLITGIYLILASLALFAGADRSGMIRSGQSRGQSDEPITSKWKTVSRQLSVLLTMLNRLMKIHSGQAI